MPSESKGFSESCGSNCWGVGEARSNSEQFRSVPGTFRPVGGRLMVRRTDYEGGSPRVRHTTARIRHLVGRRCGGGVAARGTRAAADDAGDRVSQKYDAR